MVTSHSRSHWRLLNIFISSLVFPSLQVTNGSWWQEASPPHLFLIKQTRFWVHFHLGRCYSPSFSRLDPLSPSVCSSFKSVAGTTCAGEQRCWVLSNVPFPWRPLLEGGRSEGSSVGSSPWLPQAVCFPIPRTWYMSVCSDLCIACLVFLYVVWAHECVNRCTLAKVRWRCEVSYFAPAFRQGLSLTWR